MTNGIIKKISTAAILLSLSIAFVSCKQYENPHSDTQINDEIFGYPLPVEFPESEEALLDAAYPVFENESSDPVILEIPTPSEGVGIVYGRLLTLSIDQPISYSQIYLGTKLEIDPGDEYIISFQDNTSPHAVSTLDGEFLILDIPPDNYILILVTPINIYPILDRNGEYVEVVISGGDSLDLGIVFAKWPDLN